MSKSRGNVIIPQQVIAKHGTDTVRIYEMFMGPFSQAIAWDTKGVKGVRRFLQKVWGLFEKFQTPNSKSQVPNSKLKRLLHKTIKKVSEDIENLKFNTAVSSLMVLVNEMEKQKEISQIDYSLFLILLSPFAPHITEELYQRLKGKPLRDYQKRDSIFSQKWPKYEPKLVEEEKITLVVQINGKVREKIKAEQKISEKKAKELALKSPKVKKWLAAKKIKKTIFVPGKIINFVVRKDRV